MITAFFIFNRKGDVLISRLFRDNIRRNISDVFRIQVIASPQVRSPVLTLGSTTFLHIKGEGLWYVAVTRSNQDAAIVFEYLYKLKHLLETQFGSVKKNNGGNIGTNDSTPVNEVAKIVSGAAGGVSGSSNSGSGSGGSGNGNVVLTEDDVVNNFIIIYEIVDQVLDFGYPQNMEAGVLLPFLTQPLNGSGNSGNSSSLLGKVSGSNSNSTFNNNNNSGNGNSNLSSILRSPDIGRRGSSNNTLIHGDEGDEVAWRRHGIKYRKNQVYLDIKEEINVLMTANGTILKSYVDGHIQMKTKLSGMPVCNFGFNDSLIVSERDAKNFLQEYDVKNPKAIPQAAAGTVVLEDCKFHQSVQLDKFDSDRLIRFIPPDGEFELMKYRASENVNLPFLVAPKVEEAGKSLMNFNISIRSLFPPKLVAFNVVLKVPVPPGSIKANLEATGGKAKFSSEEGAIFWRFNKFHGQYDATLQGFVDIVPGSITSVTNADKLLNSTPSVDGLKSPVMSLNILGWSRPPMILNFNLDTFSCSGLVVRYLKIVEKSNYSTVKWVKYLSKAGTYEIRY